jgi:deoxyribose-phosphate aldolase
MPGASDLAPYFDHTLLNATATPADIERLCAEATTHGFASVCVHGVHVARCVVHLGGTPVKTAAVVGFPFGADRPEVKRRAAELAIEDGARELDVVIAIGALRAGLLEWVAKDLEQVVRPAKAASVCVKGILEVGALTRAEIEAGCRLLEAAGADFVKTCTGYGPRGVTLEDVALLRSLVGSRLAIKASGGVRGASFARALIEAGCTRIGSSSSVAIVGELLERPTKSSTQERLPGG